MFSQFHFKNFDANEEVKSIANVALDRLNELDGGASTAVGLLEKEEHGYRCSLDIHSRRGPFMASTVRPEAQEAIRAAELKLKKQIEWSRSHWGLETGTVE